jgi:hypothetical protein
MSNRSNASLLGVALVLGALAPSGEVLAAPPAPTSASSGTATDASARADKLAADATKAVSRGALEDARKLFLASIELKPSFDTLGNLGAVELAMKRHRDCAEHLAASLRSYPPTGSDTLKKKTEEKLNECRSKVGAVRLEVTPDGVSVAVDGRTVGTTPLPGPLFLEPGARTLEFTLEGHRPAQRSVDSTAGRESPLLVRLEAEPPPAPVVAPKPTAPATTAVAAPKPVDPLERTGAPLWPLVAGGAGTAILLGAGVALFVGSNATERDGDSQRTELAAAGKRCPADCAGLIETYDSASAQRNAATGLFVGAGIAAAGTAAYYFLARPGTKPSTTAWLPVFDERGAGLLVRGTF